MKQSDFNKGAAARENFEETMTKLFRAPKPPKATEQPKKKAAPEEKKN